VYLDASINPFFILARYGKLGHLRKLVNGRFYSVNPVQSNNTANRPTTNLYAGFQYYDTTLGKPIWYNGTAWTDSTGTVV
jgi:hypothetical protein